MAQDTKHSGNIEVKGARVNNLKNIDVTLPRGKFIVITGLSGSGKSSLAFDTLYAEGQRRYVESLSSYARQFMGRMRKPECDFIRGLPPAIAIEQKVSIRNARSTVGTSTEIYDYLRLLFARVGKTYSPISGEMVKKHTANDVVETLNSYPDGTRFAIVTELVIPEGRDLKTHLDVLLSGGYSRLMRGEAFVAITDVALSDDPGDVSEYRLLIDRMSVTHSHITRLGFQARPMASGTHRFAAITCQQHTILDAVTLALYPLEKAVDAGPLSPVAMPQQCLLFGSELIVRAMDGEVVGGGHMDELALGLTHHLASPAHHSIVIDRERLVGNHQILVDAHHLAVAFAGGASAQRIVEVEELVGGLGK